ncbi:MAG TPA: hypothetical protein VFI37_12140 [Gaiellaceae bacterium]|nr:hypothetical protein [Gaiellaceae bacterium]
MGILLMALGAWAFIVPLVGPYFNFGFFTDNTWSFSAQHWELLLLPGIAIFLGGLIMTMPSAGLGWLGGLLAAAGGAWLLVGPSLHPLWTSATHTTIAVPHGQTLDALLWIGYFYGTGALTTWLAGFGKGLLSRRTVVHDSTVIEETPVDRRDRVTTTV